MPGANENAGSIGDIHDLMNDKDLFRGLDLADLAGVSGLGGAPGSSSGGGGLDLSSFALDFMNSEGERGMGDGNDNAGSHGGHGHGGLAGLLFEEDEELALANLEFRPRKIPKSMSMTHLSELAGEGEEALPPMPGAVPGAAHGRGRKPDLSGRPPLPPKHASGNTPPPLASNSATELGPLGQPIRRTNTFTSSLPSFEEGAETHNHNGGALRDGSSDGGGGGISLDGHSQGADDEDDLMKHFLSNDNALDDVMRMLGE
ncbi:hypothetical protein KSW81_003475 [Nannochloris sp. 'desiccata']|nr:hypothetical protein KSW81_003475 [Chlorella desiccata (nom. nud.)]